MRTDIPIPRGFCQCGCGGRTALAPQTHIARGLVRGEPMHFIQYHRVRVRGAAAPAWRGGTKVVKGYVLIQQPDHPHANSQGYVQESILVASNAVGHALPDGAVVHHVDEVPDNNSPKNLVVCQDQSYHMLLHMRMRALAACGNANWRKCKFCKQYDDPANLFVRSYRAYHSRCANEYQREQRKKRHERVVPADEPSRPIRVETGGPLF